MKAQADLGMAAFEMAALGIDARAAQELREQFRLDVLAAAQHVQASAAVGTAPPTAEGVAVQPLATLSKLVFRERECLRNL